MLLGQHALLPLLILSLFLSPLRGNFVVCYSLYVCVYYLFLEKMFIPLPLCRGFSPSIIDWLKGRAAHGRGTIVTSAEGSKSTRVRRGVLLLLCYMFIRKPMDSILINSFFATL